MSLTESPDGNQKIAKMAADLQIDLVGYIENWSPQGKELGNESG